MEIKVRGRALIGVGGAISRERVVGRFCDRY